MPSSNGEKSPPRLITEPLKSFAPQQLYNGDLRMAIACAGQKAYSCWGEERTLSEEFLSHDYRTWEGGLVSMNHDNNNELLGGATIYDVDYDPEKKLVIASFANLPDMAQKFIKSDFYQGLSQECIPIQTDEEGNVLKGYGTGVTLVSWPYQPAATQEMGVGVRPALAAILASKYPIEDTMTDKQGGGTPATGIPEAEYRSIVSENVQLKSTITALESDNKKKDDEIASWKQKYSELESGEITRTKMAVENAIRSYESDLRATSEKAAVITELRSYLGEHTDKYLDTNPSLENIKATIEIQKSIFGEKKAKDARDVGSSVNIPPQDEPKTHVSAKFTPDPWAGKLNVEVN